MTRSKILELRDIRLTVEGLAAARAAEHARPEEVAQLRQLALELVAARQRGALAADIAKLTAFQFAPYRAAPIPLLLPPLQSLSLSSQAPRVGKEGGSTC